MNKRQVPKHELPWERWRAGVAQHEVGLMFAIFVHRRSPQYTLQVLLDQEVDMKGLASSEEKWIRRYRFRAPEII